MAKALVGHLRIEQRVPSRAAQENQRLRRRVADLEALVLQLKIDSERLELELARARTLADSVVAPRTGEMLPA